MDRTRHGLPLISWAQILGSSVMPDHVDESHTSMLCTVIDICAITCTSVISDELSCWSLVLCLFSTIMTSSGIQSFPDLMLLWVSLYYVNESTESVLKVSCARWPIRRLRWLRLSTPTLALPSWGWWNHSIFSGTNTCAGKWGVCFLTYFSLGCV